MNAMHVKVLRLIGLALAISIANGCDQKKPDSASGQQQEADSAAARDKEAADLLKDPKTAEARQWLAADQTKHMGFKMSKSVMLEWAEKFYAAGAKKVWATGIETMGQMDICALFVIEMPDDPAARLAVLKVEAALDGEEAAPVDKGGNFLKVALD